MESKQQRYLRKKIEAGYKKYVTLVPARDLDRIKKYCKRLRDAFERQNG